MPEAAGTWQPTLSIDIRPGNPSYTFIPQKGTSYLLDDIRKKTNQKELSIMEIKAFDWNNVSRIKELWEGLNDHHLLMSTNFKHFYSEFTFEKRMKSLSKRDRLVIFVVQDLGKDIGYCIASVDDLVGEIDSVFVQAPHRRTGVGTKLITLALQWLQNQGCETIRVGIAEGNEAATGFYRRFGFAERMIVMQRTP